MKKLRTFKIDDSDYEILQAIGNGNATAGLLECLFQYSEHLTENESKKSVKIAYPMFYAKYCLKDE